MIVIKCPSTVASGSSAWNPGFVDGRHDEGSHEPIPPIWTRSSCRHRWRPLMHAIQPLPLSRCWYNAICVDIHRLVWIGGWRDVPHIVNSIPSTPYFRDRRLHVYSGLHHATSRKKQKNRAIFQKENANFCRIRLHHEKNQKGAILIPKEECKLLPQNPKKHFFGIFLEFIKIGIPKKLSTLRQNFFANFFCIFFWNSSRFS